MRRDTTNSAALALTSQENSSNIDSVLEEEEPVVSIDDALGPADDDNVSEADILDSNKLEEVCDEEVAENGEDKEDKTTEPETTESSEMAIESNVSESTNGKGATEVVTSVSVVCNSENSEVGGNERGEESPASDSNTNGTHTKTDSEASASTSSQPASQEHMDTVSSEAKQDDDVNSTEIIIPAADERHNNSFTINSSDPDGDASDSDDEEGDGSSISTTTPPPVDIESCNGESKTPIASPPPVITVEPAENKEVKENGEVKVNGGVKENGEVIENGGVKENGEVKKKEEVKENGVVPSASEDQSNLLPAAFNPNRRSKL